MGRIADILKKKPHIAYVAYWILPIPDASFAQVLFSLIITETMEDIFGLPVDHMVGIQLKPLAKVGEQLRLRDGGDATEGRLEVLYDGM